MFSHSYFSLIYTYTSSSVDKLFHFLDIPEYNCCTLIDMEGKDNCPVNSFTQEFNKFGNSKQQVRWTSVNSAFGKTECRFVHFVLVIFHHIQHSDKTVACSPETISATIASNFLYILSVKIYKFAISMQADTPPPPLHTHKKFRCRCSAYFVDFLCILDSLTEMAIASDRRAMTGGQGGWRARILSRGGS